MKITLKETPEQVELIKALASKDLNVAYEAKAAVADLVGPIISEVINNAMSITNLYTTLAFSEDDNLSIPLDLYHDITDEDYIRVHSQTMAGGLSSNELYPAHDELKFKTYSLDSAWSFDKKYARKARLDVVSKTFTRMAQEFLAKQEKTSINQLLGALAAADTNVGAGAVAGNHIIETASDSVLTIHDFNNLITRSKRLWSSFSSGTPVDGAKVGITDLLMSPEMTEEIRALAYQPVNTRSGAVDTSGASSIAATDSMREQILSAGGLPSIFGIGIIELLEFGIGQRYNKIFDALKGSISFTQASDEILVGIDRRAPGLWRPAVREEGVSSDVNVMVDDQFAVRQSKIGYFAKIVEGRCISEDRCLTALIC